MTLKIEKAAGIGFCFGVKRAIDTLEKVALERGRVETLGAIVHNQQVLQRLASLGVRIADSIKDIQGYHPGASDSWCHWRYYRP